MSGIYTDTEKIYKELLSTGLSEDQASGIVQAIRSLELRQFATKADLEIAIMEFRNDMVERLSGQDGKLEGLRGETVQRFTEQNSMITEKNSSLVKWMVGLSIAQTGFVFAALLALFNLLLGQS